MVEPLSEVEYGRILGSFTAVAEDFGDTVAPDAIPLTGKVTFTPTISHVSYINSDGETASLYLSPIEASIVGGRLVGSDGNDGVTLLASNSNNVSASVLWNASIHIDPLGPDQDAPEVHKFLIEVRRNEISSLIDVIKANSRVHNVALFHDAIAEAAAKFWERVEAGEFRGNQGPPGPAGVGVGVPGPVGRPGIIGKDGDPGVGGNLLPDGDLEEPGFLVTGDYQESSDAVSGSKAVTLTNATSRKIRLEPETSYIGTVYLKSPEASTATITMRVFGSEGDIDRVIENAYDLPADSWRKVTFLLDSNLGDQSMEIITASDGRTISADLYTLSDNSVVQGLQRDLTAAQEQLEAAMAQLDQDLAEVESNRVILGESLKDLAVVLEDADVDLTELNTALEDLKNDLATEESRRQAADDAAQLILDQLDTNLAQARTDLDANSAIIDQLDTDLAQSLVDLEASRVKIDTLENTTIPGLKATLEEADRQARADLDTLSGLLSGLDTALQENDQTIEELTTTILPELRTSLEENSTALSGMDTTLSQAKTDLAQLSTDLTTEREERIAAVGAAQGTITELDGKLSTAFPDGPFNVPNELAQTIYRSDVQYAVSSSETVAPTTGWSGNSPTREPGEFVWFRTVVTYGDGTTATSGAALMTGNTGEAGRPGEKGDPGEDGTSVTIKGTLDSVSDLPATGNAGDSYLVGGYLYIWSGSWENVGLIRGPQGVPGEPGADGKPTYTWVKYADTSTGLGMSDDPAGKRYLGLAHNKTDQTESTNASDYQWALFEGPEGPQGLEGPPGENGESLYTWLKYADSPTTGMSDSPVGKKYMGIAYNKTTPNESTTYSDYTWALIEGEQGVRGPAGADGKTTYTWVKYGTSAAGADMSDSPEGKTYIGLAYNKTTQTESTVPGDYTWSLIQGPKGDKGTTGDQGVSVESITPHYRQEESSAPKPSQPSGMAPAGWTAEEPLWAQNTALWRAERVIYSNNVISWTPVTLVSAHTGIDKAIIDAREASNAAVAAQEKLEALKIGSVNLLNDSLNFRTISSDTSASREHTNTDRGGRVEILDSSWRNAYRFVQPWIADEDFYVNAGQQYTLSVDVRASFADPTSAAKLGIDVRGNGLRAPATTEFSDTGGRWQRISVTLTIPDEIGTSSLVSFSTANYTLVEGDMFEYRDFKLEKGNRGTDWSPSLADQQAVVAAAQAKADAAQDRAEEAYGKAESAGTEAQAAQDRADDAMARATSPTSNMIHNGNGHFGNENFTANGWKRYPEDAPAGASASFGITYAGAIWLDKHVAVDPSRKYRMMATVRQANPDYAGSDLFYMALMPVDSDGQSVQPYHYARYPETQTTLAEPLNAGDNQARIATVTPGWSGVNWNNAYLAIYNYVDSNGKAWGEAYSRNINRADSIDGDIVALRSPYAGETIPAGTPVGVNASGGNYMYPLTTGPVPHEWTSYTSLLIGGIHDGSNATSAGRSFPEMTASVRPGFLLNYTSQIESRHRVANVGFYDVTDSLPGQDAAYWSGWRDVTSNIYPGISGYAFISRSGREVRLMLKNIVSDLKADRSILPIPSGFYPPSLAGIQWELGSVMNNAGTISKSVSFSSTNIMIRGMDTAASGAVSGMLTWVTEQPISTALPGTTV